MLLQVLMDMPLNYFTFFSFRNFCIDVAKLNSFFGFPKLKLRLVHFSCPQLLELDFRISRFSIKIDRSQFFQETVIC